MRGSTVKILLVVSILLQPAGGNAAGFLIFEAGAKALGMGGALVAQADDPSAIFFNPAGIAHLEGTNLYGGVSLIFAGTEFAGVDPSPGFGTTGSTGTLLFTPINAYITHMVRPGLAVGVGVFNPFGLGQEWENPTTFSGRYITHDVSLHSFNINPTVAWSPNERFSVGAGVQLLYANVELHQYIQQWDPNGTGLLDVGTVELAGDNGLDFGFNVGVRMVPDDRFILGLSFRSQMKADINDGTADFNQVPSGNAALDAAVAQQFPPDQSVKAIIDLPWLLSVAAAYTGLDRWVFEIDFNTTGWSEFEQLAFDFADSSLNTVRPQDYETKLSIRTGAGFDLTEEIQLRGGYYWDPTPQPEKSMSPLLADADRHGVTIGVGVDRGAWTLDLFGLFILTGERETEGQSLDNFDGTYATFANLFGVNVGYGF